MLKVFTVINKATGEVCKSFPEYQSEAPVEWSDYPFSEYDHVEQPPVSTETSIPADSTNWKIWVGSFFDRFEPYKLAVLSSDDALIKAAILDASVRKYIDLFERRTELSSLIDYIQSKGFNIDKTKILDLVPSEEEVWHD